MPAVGLCIIELHLPGIRSLKQKRSIVKSMLEKSRNRFNVSSAEVDYHNMWQSSEIAFTTVSNSAQRSEKVLNDLLDWIEMNYPDEQIVHHSIEII